MDRTPLAKQLEVAVATCAEHRGVEVGEVMQDVADRAGVAPSTVRQDVHGYIKKPNLDRLATYASVTEHPLDVLLDAAKAAGLDYIPADKKLRDSARSASDLRFNDTTEGEWNKPDLADWKDELDFEGQWADATQEQKAIIAGSTLFGEVDADTFAEANTYPLVEPGAGLNMNALDSAWRLAGRAPDPEGARRTLESLANEHFDMSFRDDDDDEEMRAAPNVHVDTDAQTDGKQMDSPLKSTLETKNSPDAVDPFTDKVHEDDTEFKGSMHAEIKDVDQSSRIVTGYYAAWTPDAADDKFEPGAFEESIKKFGPQADKQRIVHLNQHLTREPIGRPITLKEDDHGLYFETLIADSRKGRDVMALYDAGVITEHSVGFQRQEEEQKDDLNHITKALLLEGSNVTWGSNSDTPFTGFKSSKQAIKELVNYASSLKSALKEDLTQTTAREVEHGIDTIESQLRQLMDAVGDLAEESEQANADPIKKGDLNTALRSFKEQMGAIEENTSSTRNDELGISIPTPDLKDDNDTESDVTDLVPDTDFFAETDA